MALTKNTSASSKNVQTKTPHTTSGKYKVYTDPSVHSWVKVSKTELVELGIAHKISKASYMNRDDVYLDQDEDAVLFMHAKREQKPYWKVAEHLIEVDIKTNSVLFTFEKYSPIKTVETKL